MVIRIGSYLDTICQARARRTVPLQIPRTAFRTVACGRLLPALVAVFVFINRIRLDEIVLEQAVFEFLAGDTRRLERSRVLNERRGARHNLARASCRKHNVSKLALRSFCQHSHFSLSPQTMPEVLPPVVCAWRWSSE